MVFSLSQLAHAFLVYLVLPLTTAAVLDTSVSGNSWDRNATTGYGTILTSTNGSVVTAVVNNPPIQLYNYKLVYDFHDFITAVDTAENPPKVVIIRSAIPGYWMNYIDIHVLSATDPPPPGINETDVSLTFRGDVATLSNSSVIFIAEMNGRTMGAGNEVAIACDMRFAGPDLLVGTLETAIGITHANGGIPYLVNFLGRGRAFEYLLSAGTADAKTAERINWVNTAYDTEEELQSAVEKLAHRIALFPRDALVANKIGINRAKPNPAWIQEDLEAFLPLVQSEIAQMLINKFISMTDDLSVNAFNLGLTGDIEGLYE